MKTLIIFLFLFTALQKANSISPADIPETASKTINAIYLNSINHFGKKFKICNNDITTLQDIALQCPYQYGTAVFQARMLLSFIDTTEYYNECENYYVSTGNLKTIAGNKTNTDENIGFKVFPNPAKDFITVLNTTSVSAFIEVFDYIGKRIILQEIKDYSNEIKIKELNEGIYLYKITTDNNVVKTDKFIVIK